MLVGQEQRVPTAEERSNIPKLNNLLEKYRDISRKKGRQSAAQLSKDTDFESAINPLFDIAYCQAMELIVIEEDRLFLEDQREQRKLVIGKVDTKLTGEEERKRRRILEQHERQMKEDRRKQREVAACSALLRLGYPDYIATGVFTLSSENEVVEYTLWWPLFTKLHCLFV